jgi:hypothetical protein
MVTSDYLLIWNTRNLTAPAHLLHPTGSHYSVCGKVYAADKRMKTGKLMPNAGPHALCRRCFHSFPTLRQRIVAGSIA